jgi:transcriptional regulator GlxA family with amidase domain
MAELTVGILVFDGVEVLDFCGPFEVFSVARQVHDTPRVVDSKNPEGPNPPPPPPPGPAFRVVIVAESANKLVTTTGGMKVHASDDYDSCPKLDVLVVPGGLGTRQERFNASTQRFVLKQVPSLRVLASVCTGSLILSEVGLLNGRRATTHWKALDLMEQEYPSVHVVRNKHWVRVETAALEPDATQASSSGPSKLLFTSAGISAGIDMSLKVVEDLLGEATARATALHMEYPYPESDERRVPALNI